MKVLIFVPFFLIQAGFAQAGEDAAAIMAKMAANMEKSAESRRQYVYQQVVKGSMIRGDGKLSRKESREYAVPPQATRTEKKRLSLKGK